MYFIIYCFVLFIFFYVATPRPILCMLVYLADKTDSELLSLEVQTGEGGGVMFGQSESSCLQSLC